MLSVAKALHNDADRPPRPVGGLRLPGECALRRAIQSQASHVTPQYGKIPYSVSLTECERASTAMKTCTVNASAVSVGSQPTTETGRCSQPIGTNHRAGMKHSQAVLLHRG